MRSILAALLIALLAACEAGGTEQPGTPAATEAAAEDGVVSEEVPQQAEGAEATTPEAASDDDSQCGADKLGRWLNVLPTAEVKAQIAAAVGQRPIRYIGPGDAVTMDFSPARLNVELGTDGRIKQFRCG